MQFHNRPMSFGPVITTASPLVSGEVGFPYSFQFNGTQGLPPYTWAVVSGAVPAGLTLSSSGMLFGTPTTPQASVFGLQITDSNGAKSNIAAFNMTVVAASVITTTSPLPNANQGTAYSTTIAATGVSPFIWSIPTQTGSNAWVIDQNTGILSGTPGAVETDSITVQALDALGYPVQKVFSLTVVANQAATPTFSPPAGTYTSAQSVTISCSTPSSTIYYTTDGSTPTTGSTVYTTPIKCRLERETVQAIATAAGYSQSNVGSAAYTISAVVVSAQQKKFIPGISVASIGVNQSPTVSAAWNSGTAYVIGDQVNSGRGVLLRIANNTNSSPPSANWALSASGTGANGGDRTKIAAAITANPAIFVGWSPIYNWHFIQPTAAGQYPGFYAMLADFNAWQTASPGAYFVPQVSAYRVANGTFNPNGGASIIPAYILSGGSSYGNTPSGGSGNGWMATGYSAPNYTYYEARLDNALVNAEWLKLFAYIMNTPFVTTAGPYAGQTFTLNTHPLCAGYLDWTGVDVGDTGPLPTVRLHRRQLVHRLQVDCQCLCYECREHLGRDDDRLRWRTE